ncbi:CorA family divalent cation transporter [Mesorhizobium sp. MSK_1335]|uniref:CorA family divalent cation transporter n=1 Tax=Mesorhizobium montanum TaxID=3072323 RepID=A0ABU4ZGM1_9HYPH|nr:CorA family divalent cation transporter [Mesorhizobium sp. MSK_1335]MDX8523198.1 CorA family divalent cation transporter [Mesorhizobium sp. MSK_1335]
MNDASHLTLLAWDDSRHHAPGLIWAYRGNADAPAQPIAPKDIEAAIAAQDGWVWLHVDLIDQRAHSWISQACALPQSAHAILEGHEDSMALAHEKGVVHGIAADLHGEIGRRSTTIGRLHFAVTDRLLVTGRRHSLAAVEEVNKALSEGFQPATAFELFGAIVLGFCKSATGRLALATKQLDEVEDHLVTERLADERRRIKDVRRLGVSLHRPISAQAALFQEENRAGWELSAGAHDILGKLSARLKRLDREVVMVNDRARLLQEEVAAELADESNRSLKALAVMSALLLPGTLIVGIFGMNTEGLPLTHTHGGFLLAMLLAGGATGLFYWLLLRAGADLKF